MSSIVRKVIYHASCTFCSFYLKNYIENYEEESGDNTYSAMKFELFRALKVKIRNLDIH